MGWFQLDPESLAARARAAGAVPPTLPASLLRGAAGFTVVSVAGFVPWAVFGHWLGKRIGEAGLYATCAIVFIGLAGLLLHRLILGPGSLNRFYKLFGVSFAAYSLAWIAGWMSLHGHPGSVAGLLAGTAVMGGMLVTAFEARGQLLTVIGALFVLNSLGYFVGGVCDGAIYAHSALTAKLMWGVCYGLGLGAGLGLAFHLCQSRARALLAAPADFSSSNARVNAPMA
ncbi:MAG TPA: hypothetical protein VMB21_20060 [Candidatus Limnocylindria bacterium]|jgi:hypothetical protein|nr:hypothetical protein [Candidatus Limnocylindria bacterium]